MSTARDTLDGKPRILDWGDPPGDYASAPDGTAYSLIDDWARRERRWWMFVARRPGDRPRGADNRFGPLPIGEREPWQQFEGSTNKQTVRNRAERHARMYHATPGGQP